ncbi:MAG: LysR family transcriptional regulator [Dokdonella sp.]|uniref:LysR family transcriptional regulator n=1 Tax=Dokdonella sp. TaxID=2291710 RepID=UPI0032645E53
MSSEPDWGLYRTFLAVLDEGSLSAAARRLGLTQPTAARHIDALQQSVGAELFLRSSRGLIPTETALGLRPIAQAIAVSAAEFLRAASADGDVVSGTVRVTASEVVGVEHLPAILARLRRQHPALAVELVLSNRVDNLLAREADIAVRMTPPEQDALIVRRFPSVTIGMHAHSDYLARRGVPRSLAELADHDIIGFDTDTATTRLVTTAIPSLSRSTFALRSDSDLAQLAAIRAGLGLGICQTSVALRERDLVRVLATEVEFELGLWIVMHESLKNNARCKAVFAALVDGLSVLGI